MATFVFVLPRYFFFLSPFAANSDLPTCFFSFNTLNNKMIILFTYILLYLFGGMLMNRLNFKHKLKDNGHRLLNKFVDIQ